jgi:hypothetical protein
VPHLGSGIMYVSVRARLQKSLPGHEFGHWGYLSDPLPFLGFLMSKTHIMYNRKDREKNVFPVYSEYKAYSPSFGIVPTDITSLVRDIGNAIGNAIGKLFTKKEKPERSGHLTPRYL